MNKMVSNVLKGSKINVFTGRFSKVFAITVNGYSTYSIQDTNSFIRNIL